MEQKYYFISYSYKVGINKKTEETANMFINISPLMWLKRCREESPDEETTLLFYKEVSEPEFQYYRNHII